MGFGGVGVHESAEPIGCPLIRDNSVGGEPIGNHLAEFDHIDVPWLKLMEYTSLQASGFRRRIQCVGQSSQGIQCICARVG